MCKECGIPQSDKIKNISFNRNILNCLRFFIIIVEHFHLNK